MKKIAEYITESLSNTVVKTIIKEFIKNIDNLSIIRKQHFLTRLSLCDVPEAGGLKLDTGIDDVIKVTKDVVNLMKDRDYKSIMDKYIVIPYKNINSDKDKVYDWLMSFDDETVLEYFAIGYLSEKLDIIERTDSVDSVDFWDDIYPLYTNIDKFVELHNADDIDCRNNCGTIYVNWMGNAYYVLKSDKLSFPKTISADDWRKTRKIFTSMDKYDNISVYGVTHSIINGSRYYTQPLDSEEFDAELKYINQFLAYERMRNYKLGDFVTIDLICECALCLKLSKQSKYSEWKPVIKYMISKVDKDTHILQSNTRSKNNKKENLEKNEHSNVLFILLNTIKL